MTRQRKDYRKPPGRPFKSGSRALARFVAQGRLDRRTWLSRFVEQTEAMLSEDAGGPEHLTHRETLLVSMAATLWTEYQLMVWQRQQAILRGETVHDSDKYFLAHTNSLRRTLETLGLRPTKVERNLPRIEDYWAETARQTTPEAPSATNEGRDDAEAAPDGEDRDGAEEGEE